MNSFALDQPSPTSGKHRGMLLPRLATLAGTLAASMALTSLSSPAYGQAAPSSRVQPAMTAATAPKPVPSPSSLMVPASVQAFFVTDLYAKDSGYVSHINNDIGDHVKKGQVLAVIDNPELQAQYNKAKAGVQQAKAAFELQGVTLARQKELFAGNATTAQTMDEARIKEDMAKADLGAATAEMERLQALLGYDKITAPYDCVITRRMVNPGDLVQASTASRTAPLFTCEQHDPVRVFADVPDAYAGRIRLGLPVSVQLYDASTVTFHGTITRITGSLDQASRTMRVEIDLPNHDGKLIPGKYVQVSLEPAVVPAHTAAP